MGDVRGKLPAMPVSLVDQIRLEIENRNLSMQQNGSMWGGSYDLFGLTKKASGTKGQRTSRRVSQYLASTFIHAVKASDRITF